MKIKSMQKFRHDFKMSKKGTQSECWDENFMGHDHGDISGFFAMYHGLKEEIYGFLRKETEMAEDGQAIYEFVQNAADSNSSHFYMFYNEKYFLAINNGEAFTKEGIKSILNVGQSHGKENDPDKIGRFGIGFKLVHRLVGKTNGLKELTEDYCGPNMFSWSNKSDFVDFTTAESFESVDESSSSPWLMKILLTNFPASVDEKVKDMKYNDFVPFPKEEIVEFQKFLKENLPDIDQNVMHQGTMFFIKLGENKIDLLNKDQDDISNRLENTLYFLKNLTLLQVNKKIINRHKGFVVEDKFIIQPEEDDFKEIGLDEKRDKSFPISLQLGYVPYGNKDLLVKGFPNFYKYFPMEDTNYGLQFIFHSNVFSIGSNRRHIHEDNVNSQLLKLFADRLIGRIEQHISTNSKNAYDIFANILLSDCNKPFVEENLMKPLLNYIGEHVPTNNGQFLDKDIIIIKDVVIDCSPSDFGLEKNWFKWNKSDGNDSELIKEAKNSSKLGIKSYSLKDLLEEGEISSINLWIERLSDSEFDSFIEELDNNTPTCINKIKFLKLENGEIKSISEIVDGDILIKFPKIESIEGVLRKLGFKLSKTNFENLPNLKYEISQSIEYLKEDAEAKLFEKKIIFALPVSSLTPIEKKTLFLSLGSFKNIAEKTLSEKLLLFCNKAGVKQPLARLVDPTIIELESWMKDYCIRDEEVFNEIKSEEFLRGSNTIFNDIIVPDWTKITEKINLENVLSFYKSVVKYYSNAVSPLSLKSKPIVFCGDNGWKILSENVFFHSQLATFSKYTDLYEVFDEIGINYPVKSILEVLSNEPFGIQDSSIEKLMCSGTYSKEAIFALLEFCKGKVNLFDYGYLCAESENIRLVTGEDSKQYYSEKIEVLDFVESYCENALIPLPEEFSAFKDAVLRGEKLFKEIIDTSKDNWKDNDEVLALLLTILTNSGLKDISKGFVNSADCIKLSSTDVNELDISFLWIKLLNSIFEINEFEAIKYKVTIDGVSLSELSWNNVVSLETDSEIELGSILPKFEDTKAVSIIRDKLIKSNKFDSNKINALFQSNTTPTFSELAEIAEEMLTEESNQLKNPDQLRLVIYLYKNKALKSIDEIKVLAIDENWYSLADSWYLKEYDFIDKDAVLNSCYEGIGQKSFGEYAIISKPYFQRDSNSFICPHLKESLRGDTLINFFELVKDQIIKNAQSNVDWLDSFTANIGFVPKWTVFADTMYVHSDEELPEELVIWANKSNENSKVLYAIGVNGKDSPIVKLRKYLLKQTAEYSFEGFSKSSKSDTYLLMNSMDIMSKVNIEFDDEFGAIIKSITEFISPIFDISEILLPNAARIEGNQLYYQLNNFDAAYLLNSDFLGSVKKFTRNDYTAFIKTLIDDDVNIVDPDCLSDDWKRKYTKLLQFNDAEIDIDSLDSESDPCDLPQYLSWKENTDAEISIYFIEDAIPYHVSVMDFEDKVIEYREGDYFFESETEILYTKREAYNEAVIKELKELIDSDEFTALIGGTGAALSSSRENELLQEIQKLKEKLNAISPGEDMERGGLGNDSQKDWNLEARNMLRNHLSTVEGFDCSGWDDSNIPASVVKGVKYKKKPCTWIVRSAMSQKAQFHLTPYEWTLLEQKNVFLALRTGHDEIRIYGIDQDIRKVIFENNHTININFDSELLTFEGIDGFAKLLVQFNVWGSGLVFKNPEYSAGNSFKDLEKCKDGIINKLSDDVL